MSREQIVGHAESRPPARTSSGNTLKYIVAGLMALAIGIGSFLVARADYPLFHSFADIITVFVASSVFVVVWSRRRSLDNDYYLYISIAFLFFAFLDFLHMLGNKGMGVFPKYGNLGPTLYIASRYELGISLLIAPLFIKRKLNAPILFAAYGAATVLVLLAIFYWQNFPVTYIEGVGLTSFKVISDYAICAGLLGAIGLLFINRRSFDPYVFKMMVASMALSIATGLSFTLYTDPFAMMNMVGHFFQMGSFFFVYLAFVDTALAKPQDILYRNLAQSREVAVKLNAELEKVNLDLKQDIAQRQKAEQALKESEERFNKAFHASPVAFAITKTSDGTFIDVNDSCEKLMGYSRQEIVGRKTTELNIYVNPGQRAEIVRQISENGQVRDQEMTFRRKDGQLIQALSSLEVINVGSEELYLSMLIDITKRKEAEAALRESEARFRSVLDSSRDVIVRFNLQTGRYEYVSPSVQVLMGYTPDEFAVIDQQTALQMIHPDEVGALRSAQARSEETGEAEVEYRQRNKAGDYIWVSNRMSVTRDESGRPLYRNSTIRDVTERHKADQLKDEFIGMVSHEIKTPLTVIIGALMTATTAGLPEEVARDLMQDAVTHADILNDITDNLLELSRSQSDRLTLQKEATDIAEVIRKVAGGLEHKSQLHKLTVDVAPDLPTVPADRLRVERIIHNLVDNAIKYSPRGGVIKITARKEPGQVLIGVSDHGIGISSLDQARLFKRFERLATRTESSIQGIGLGLNVCRILVEAHGGRIWVESEPGKGSTFFFTIPLS